jgi:hypothetical protein
MMAECECLQGCPFFNDQLPDQDGLSQMYKKKYCMDAYSDCARFMVFKELGRPGVPMDLYPNQRERATEILINEQKA